MTTQGLQFPKFYVTAPAPCPYLEGKIERKVFTELRGPDAEALNEALGRVGFRRSQAVVYRPACEGCTACVSVRVRASEHAPRRSDRRIQKRNSDLSVAVLPPKITDEQFELLKTYLFLRHSDGSMADMEIDEYRDMVETSPVHTSIIEYRRSVTGDLLAVALSDEMSDGLSMVYSFFDPRLKNRSLGTFVILDHIQRANRAGLPYVYLGYWVEGSRKMDYKRQFSPLERLGPEGWYDMGDPPA